MGAGVAALDELAAELAVQELSHGAAHAGQLRTLLRLHAVGRAAGMELSTVPHAALAMGCSEHRAGQLLSEALLLGELPGALEAVECGLLTVEQSCTIVRLLEPLPFALRGQVWVRLQSRLLAEADCGSVLPPARLSELLRRWVQQADATERRQRAEQGRRLDWRRRDDGLNDLFACGLTGPDLQAALSRVRDRAHPVGPDDERTAEQRRFDAFKDLLLGRDPLPLQDPHDPTEPCSCARAGGGRAACGCLPGAPVPCGAELLVRLTIDTALGTSDQPAELVGHGPLEPDLLQEMLLAGPRLRPVWTDEHGVLIVVGDRCVVPERGDPASVREVLLRLAALPPPEQRHPRHPHDHPTDHPLGLDVGPTPTEGPRPSVATGRLTRPPLAPVDADAARLSAAALGTHAPGTPGPYRVPRRLRRLLDARSPRCEWPGCGARAARCDAEHDLAWPEGPTCACNLGPCCRRHHRVKQLGWTKTRTAAGVSWTSPGRGRAWLSPNQHEAPATPSRWLPPLPTDDPLAELSPLQQEEELWWLADCPLDLEALELRVDEPAGPEQEDRLGDFIRSGGTRWTLELDDPYAWLDGAATPV
ncbi:MAG: putative endonuclease [Frankiales bacterium]|nr:putative endonuclease [Frankiales bacterium]